MLNIIAKNRQQLARILFNIGLKHSSVSYNFGFEKFNNIKKKDVGANSLVFNKKENNSKSDKQTNKVISQQDIQWLNSLKKLKTIKDFVPYAKTILSKESWHLAQFLHQLYRFVDKQSFKNHRQFLQEVGKGLNSFSGTGEMNAEQFIEMLRFHAKIRSIGNEMNFLHNYGFEKKAHIIAATFIYNKKFTFNQTVLIFKLLVPLGGITILFYTNFVKYFKATVSNEATSKQVGIVNLLTLLQVQFAKKNDMIIEHVLFDHVLHYLLNNLQQFLQNQSTTMQVDVLCTLLCIDSRYFYKTDNNLKKYWIDHLVNQIIERIDKNWILQISNKNQQASDNNSINLSQIIHLVEVIGFVKENMRQYECFYGQLSILLSKIINLMEEQIIRQSQSFYISNSKQFIRLVFNRQIANIWIKRKLVREKILQFMQNVQIIDQADIEPFSNYIRSKPQQYLQILLKLAKNIIAKHLVKNNKVIQSLALTYIKYSTKENALNFIKFIKLQEQNNKNQKYLVVFLRRLLQQNCKLDLQTKQISHFIKTINSYAIDYHSPQGYSVALSLFQQNFTQISSLLSSNNTNIKRSSINPLLSQESFYFAWIVFNNIINENTVSKEVITFYQRLMKNDIIKYQILTHSYQHNFPHPEQPPKLQTLNPQFSKNMTNLLKYFKNQQKYAYFIWDIFMKRYTVQQPKTREQCFQVMEQYFMEAYKKQKLRKVIMANVLTNYIASGVIIGSRLKLQALFESMIDQLFSSQDIIQYHYSCYLQIVFNAISADILSPIYFDKIIVYSKNKEPAMKQTCSLMLMYGASLKSRNEDGGVIDKSIIDYQTLYLLFLIKDGFIRQKQYNAEKTQSVTKQKRYVQITSKLVSILFEYGMCQILSLQKDIIQFLSSHWDYGQWRCMVNCYTPQNYSMKIRKQALFRASINKIMIDKLIFFKKMNLVSKAQETYFISKFK